MRSCLVIALLSCVACATSDLDVDVAASTTPMLEDAFNCQRNGLTGVPTPGNDLKRYDLATAYPDAVCNDGSTAILYYRPGVGADRTNWLIELEGGGGCKTAQECADRYCAVDPTNPAVTTGFGRQQMSSVPYPTPGIRGDGIQSQTDLRNPFRLYNHVLIHYCSSDAWTGQSPVAIGTGVDPIVRTTQVTFGTRFNGDAILFDALRVLRRDGATLPTFDLDTLGHQWVTMPDLDSATGTVVIAGGSAGGVGVAYQLDRIVAGKTGTATYVGFIDSAFSPDLASLFFQLTGYTSYQGYIEGTAPYYATRTDDSCSSMHATDAYRCEDVTHVLRNHITTPFFIRQGQTDSLLSALYTSEGFATSAGATMAMTTPDFETRVRQQGNLISSWATSAEEPPPRPVGAYIPDCPKHDPLHTPVPLFETLIGSTAWQIVWGRWTSATPPFVVVYNSGTKACPI